MKAALLFYWNKKSSNKNKKQSIWAAFYVIYLTDLLACSTVMGNFLFDICSVEFLMVNGVQHCVCGELDKRKMEGGDIHPAGGHSLLFLFVGFHQCMFPLELQWIQWSVGLFKVFLFIKGHALKGLQSKKCAQIPICIRLRRQILYNRFQCNNSYNLPCSASTSSAFTNTVTPSVCAFIMKAFLFTHLLSKNTFLSQQITGFSCPIIFKPCIHPSVLAGCSVRSELCAYSACMQLQAEVTTHKCEQ